VNSTIYIWFGTDLLRDNALLPKEKSPERLAQDDSVLNVAGSETLSRALAVITYYLLSTPEYLPRIREELKHAIPARGVNELTTSDFEKLPFLVC
jgi:cytochrome P450